MPEEFKRMFRQFKVELDNRYIHFTHKVMRGIGLAAIFVSVTTGGVGYFLYDRIQTERRDNTVMACERDKKQHVAIQRFVLGQLEGDEDPVRVEALRKELERDFPTEVDCKAEAGERVRG